MKTLYETPLGKQQVWSIKIYENDEGVVKFEIFRLDGKYFKQVLLTQGYDRPITVNFGTGKVAVVMNKDGHIAVEPEDIVASEDGTQIIHQNRVLRASMDNPDYGNLPKKSVRTGKNFADSQRIIYRESPTESHAVATDVTPTRKVTKKDAAGKVVKDGNDKPVYEFVPCEMIEIQKIGEMDGFGKDGILDLMILLLTDSEWKEIGLKLYERLKKLQSM